MATLSFPEVSTDNRFALDLELLDLRTGDTAVAILDLGQARRPTGTRGLFRCEHSAASASEVVYSACGDEAPILVSFIPAG